MRRLLFGCRSCDRLVSRRFTYISGPARGEATLAPTQPLGVDVAALVPGTAQYQHAFDDIRRANPHLTEADVDLLLEERTLSGEDDSTI